MKLQKQFHKKNVTNFTKGQKYHHSFHRLSQCPPLRKLLFYQQTLTVCWNKQTNIWQKKLGANHTHLLICRLLIFNHEQCRKGGLILGNISKEIKLLFITSITFPFFAFFCFDTLLKPLPNSKSYRFEVRRVGFDN